MKTRKEIEALVDSLARVTKEYLDEMEYFEPDESEYEDSYIAMLDEVFGDIRVGDLTFSPSRVLSELDPIAYNIGLTEYINGLDRSEVLKGGFDSKGDSFTDTVESLREKYNDLLDYLEDAGIDISEKMENVDTTIDTMEDVLKGF